MAREYKTLQFKAVETDEEGVFEGYAAVFGNIDDGNDIIEPGAFADTIVNNFDRIKILQQHGESSTIPIGKPLELREDEHGLFIKGLIVDTSSGKDMRKLLKAGVITEMSIGYDPIEPTEEDVGGMTIRHLTKVELWEVSLVTWAMNAQALVTAVKSAVTDKPITKDTIAALGWEEKQAIMAYLMEDRQKELKGRKRAANKAVRSFLLKH